MEHSTMNHDSNALPAISREPKQAYRADVDQNGEWYVWRQLGRNGWATLRRCATRNDAVVLADSLNSQSDNVAG